MELNAIETPKVFDIATDTGITPLAVKRLSLAQLKQRGEAIVERIRSEQRKEFVAAAAELPASDRTRFLIEAAKNNKASQSAVEEMADSVWCLCATLAAATSKPEAELEKLFQSDPGNLMLAYLYCLGINPDTDTATVEAPAAGKTFPPA